MSALPPRPGARNPAGETALVGESGSGKTITALSLLRLAGDAKSAPSLGGRDLLSLSKREMRGVRVWCFRTMTALNPLMTTPADCRGFGIKRR